MWSGSAETPPTMRIAMLAPSLQPTERRVAESIAADIESAIERTAQEVADIVGVGRASVIRTAQSLGYEGYPQLRVALAREVSLTGADVTETDGTMLGALRGAVDRFASRLGHTVSALTEEGLDAFVRDIDDAQRLLVAVLPLERVAAVLCVARLRVRADRKAVGLMRRPARASLISSTPSSCSTLSS